MLNALYRTAEQLGVNIHYDTELVDVDTDGGLFKSATVRQHGETRQFVARSFVAASGGFEANIAWLKEAWGDAAENFLIRGTPYNTGTVLRQLIDCGFAQVGDSKQCHAVAIDGRAPKFDGGIVTRLDCVPFGVVLNASAQRFYDEGQDFWPKRYAIWGRLVAEQPGQVAYVFIDSKSIDRFMPSIFPPLVAGTLGELAEQLGLDPDQTQRTITEFNTACLPGTFDPTGHDDCRTQGLVPPKSHWARPLDCPPYYAYPLRPGITFTYLGLKVNREGQLLAANSGHASPNMFAAGEIMAGNILGQGYLAGIGMTIGSVFGRIAGEGAARYAAN